MDETYEQLSKRVSIENPTDTRVLKIVVTDTDLEASKTVADEIAKVSSQYIADNMEQSQPKIIQTAYASKTPVNNNILKNTVIGAVLGLILAAGIVVLGYMLDDTISNADDMETRTGLKVLASLPVDETEYDGAKTKRRKKKKTQSSNQTIARIRRGQLMETVVINQIKDQSYTMKESLRALKTSISFSGKGVKSILFTSSVPNEGKTTVVMDLARSMADSKKSVL